MGVAALRMVEEGVIDSEEEAAFAREAVSAAVEEVLPTLAGTGPATVRDQLMLAYENLEKQDLYQILGLKRTCTPKDIKKALDDAMKFKGPALVNIVLSQSSARKEQQFKWHS